MDALDYLPELLTVFQDFRTCEMSTVSKTGIPIAWPVMPLYLTAEGRFVITTSIGMPQKALNIRKNPKVSLLFSDPTASGIADPAAVLVQGNAVVLEDVYPLSSAEPPVLSDVARRGAALQRAGAGFADFKPLRGLMDWYFMRLLIYVTPHRLIWWERADFSQQPREVEVGHVG